MIDLLDAMSELVYIVDIENYQLLYMNASGRQQFGIDTLEGCKCYETLQGKNSPCDFCTTPLLRETGYYTWEMTNPVTKRHYLLKDKLLSWEGRPARIEIAFDLTEKQELMEQLERLSFEDVLTGVRNHNAFVRDMEGDMIHPGQSAGIAHISVNGLKGINNCSGRSYGDQVLVKIAQAIQSALPLAQVYRIGGDEFVAVWKGSDGKAFEVGIRRIKGWAKKESAECALGYQWTNHCTNLQKLALEAEERMYQSKKKFYRDAALPRRYRASSDKILRFADGNILNRMIEEERFPVYFQPKFSVSEKRLIGAEALVRFVMDSGQFLPPDQFIPFLEDARLVDKVDFHVFAFVCQKIRQWMEAGKEVVPVSVNFSRYTVKEPWFRSTLLKEWEKYRIPKDYVEIEITESGEENCNDELMDLISQLREDGFPVSIDDFGVKYANLSIFTNSSFSSLKVDKSFISDWENPRTKEVLRALCDICQRIGVCTIAEGVEREEQLAFLEEIHCEGVQGFLFSKPLPVKEYEELYLDKSAESFDVQSKEPAVDAGSKMLTAAR